MKKLPKKAISTLARELRKASLVAASGVAVLGIHLHHTALGVSLAVLAWATTQCLALMLDSVASKE
jgi:hypothetical protein